MKYIFSDLCAQNGCKSWRTKWWKPDPSESAGVNIIQSITNLITGEHESEWCNAGFDGRPWERSGGRCWPSWKDDRLQELLKGDIIAITFKREKDNAWTLFYAQGLMDIALLTANANQLRHTLEICEPFRWDLSSFLTELRDKYSSSGLSLLSYCPSPFCFRWQCLYKNWKQI